MKFIADRFKTKKYWKQYLHWQYWKDQYKLGNDHYDKILKELVPQHLHDVYVGFNVKLKRIMIPFGLFTFTNQMFLFLPSILNNISILICYFYLVYYVIWEFRISRYTLPNWKKFIVRNSPIQDLASGLTLMRSVKSPYMALCAGCVTGGIAINVAHQMMWPDAMAPAEHLGKFISKNTGYVPTPKNK
jgi:hypothetical protein